MFDSQLAAETRTKAFMAILWSWLAILLYLWFRFGNWTFGLAAVLCLVHDLCFTLGAIALCHYLHFVPGMNYLGIEDFKIDLAAVAALLTLVGYSVSDTIVVFDRIREVRGKIEATAELPAHFRESLATLGFDPLAGDSLSAERPGTSPEARQRRVAAAAKTRRRERRGERRARGSPERTKRR